MRLTDLELYRWKFHNDIYIHTTNKYRPGTAFSATWSQYWREFGAFVSVLPRQAGKTEMIVTLLNHVLGEGEDYRIVCAKGIMRTQYRQRGFDTKKILTGSWISNVSQHLQGFKHSDISLFVDEFTYIDMKKHLCHILNYPWKRVTMVSSL